MKSRIIRIKVAVLTQFLPVAIGLIITDTCIKLGRFAFEAVCFAGISYGLHLLMKKIKL